MSNSENAKDFGEKVHVSGHPVLAHKITILRSSETRSGQFRAVLREVTYHLAYEATSRLTTQPIDITVPVPPLLPSSTGGTTAGTTNTSNATDTTTAAAMTGDPTTVHYSTKGRKLKEHVALIPIMRSGLGMVDAMLELVPNAAVHHIGMYKVLGQHPVQYFNRLPRQCTADVAYVLDPVIQTSATVMSVLSILKKWGVAEINLVTVLASRQGLKQIIDAHPNVYITVATVDEELREDGVILPGMGDAGDRLFGTINPFHQEDDDEALLHPSKRKRTMD